jgi:hypothetical protein
MWLPVAREQEQCARQALFVGIEQLINEVLFQATVPREHVRDEPV